MLSINCAISMQVYAVCPPLFPLLCFTPLFFHDNLALRIVSHEYITWLNGVNIFTRQICRDRVTTRQGHGCPNKSMATPRPGLKSRAEKLRKERSLHFFPRVTIAAIQATTRKLSFASALSLSMTSVHVRLCPMSFQTP